MQEKIVIFNDNDEGTTLYVMKVNNWDDRFETIVEAARKKWQTGTDELFGIVMNKLRGAGYDFKVMPYTELLV